MTDPEEAFISPLPLYNIFSKKRAQAAEERMAKGILFDENYRAKFTVEERHAFIANWLKYFPLMSVVNARKIGRLAGPFYTGFTFVTDNSQGAGLEPCLYVVNMCDLNVKEKWDHSVSYNYGSMHVGHDWPPEVVEEYALYEKSQSWVDLDKPITLDDIFKFYDRLLKQCFLLYNAKAPILIATWAGEPKRAQEYYDWLEERIRTLEAKSNLQGEDAIQDKAENILYLSQLRQVMGRV